MTAATAKKPKPAEVEAPVTQYAIVGFTPTCLEALPLLDDPAWHVAGMNNLHAQAPFTDHVAKFSSWFDLHPVAEIRKDAQHDAWLKSGSHGVPVYTFDPQPDWPNSVQFPKDQMVAQFGRYFTNTVSWQLALFLSQLARDDGTVPEGAKIAIYGIDMATGTEYCNSPSTRVLKSDLTWRPLGDIRVGDELVAFDEHPSPSGDRIAGRRQYRKSKVLAVQELIRPCYRLEMADGTKLISSAEHRWLTNAENTNRWQTTDRLHTPHHRTDRPSKIVKLMDVWDRAHQRDAGYLAAAFDGEGHLSMKRRPDGQGQCSVTLGFAQRDNAMLREVEAGLRHYGFDYHINDNDCRNVQIRGGRSEIIRFLGQIRPHRLLEGFDPDLLGEVHRKDLVPVDHAEFLGDQPVIGITTETGTYIAEGFASHNSAQRPSVEFFLGIAAGLGVEIIIPERSDLLKAAGLYGEADSGMLAKLNERREHLTAQLKEHERLATEHTYAAHQARGALEATQYVLGVWLQPNVDRNNPVSQDGKTP